VRARAGFALLALGMALLPAGTAEAAKSAYVEDVKFAVDELGKQCRVLLKSKKIDWKKIGRQFVKEAKKVKTDQDHFVLLVRLVARLRDGHASVRPGATTKDVRWPGSDKPRLGLGMHWCRIDGRLYVKTSWREALAAGLAPGCEIVSVEGKKAIDWLRARVEATWDDHFFSTEQQAFFHGCHWGLTAPEGERLDLKFRDARGKVRKRTLTFKDPRTGTDGPAYPPSGLKGDENVQWGMTGGGYGYVHYRRCKGDLPNRTDDALEAIGPVPGLILDFRGNGGGGFNHEAFLGRFIPKGERMSFANSYESAGAVQYGGPIVVIVDATVRSAGETASGMFKEDGRGYMIGESPTAGMSSQKTTIELPSKLYSLYVSTHSNKRQFNKSRGIEGIGVIPHEIVPFDPADLAARKDTLILRAEALLADFPQKEVPYVPKKFGWEPPPAK
jgi:carboxyl-terminal processing protease